MFAQAHHNQRIDIIRCRQYDGKFSLYIQPMKDQIIIEFSIKISDTGMGRLIPDRSQFRGSLLNNGSNGRGG